MWNPSCGFIYSLDSVDSKSKKNKKSKKISEQISSLFFSRKSFPFSLLSFWFAFIIFFSLIKKKKKKALLFTDFSILFITFVFTIVVAIVSRICIQALLLPACPFYLSFIKACKNYVSRKTPFKIHDTHSEKKQKKSITFMLTATFQREWLIPRMNNNSNVSLRQRKIPISVWLLRASQITRSIPTFINRNMKFLLSITSPASSKKNI